MSSEERIAQLEGQVKDSMGQDTIIPKFQNPDTCVFCTDKNYDSTFYLVFRAAYNQKTGKDIQKQDKETCIHYTDDWLKHSLRAAGFIWSAFTDHGNKSIKTNEVIELMENKEQREKLLKEYYDKQKHFTSWLDLYNLDHERIKNGELGRYGGVIDEVIDNDAVINDKIIHNKLKIHYTNALEVLRNFDNEPKSQL